MEKKILIIDESANDKNFLKTILRDKYQVVVSDFQKEIFSLVKSEDVDLVILSMIHLTHDKIDFLAELVLIDESLAMLIVGNDHLKSELSNIIDHEILDFITEPPGVSDITEKVERLLLRRDVFRSRPPRDKKPEEFLKYSKTYESPVFGDSVKQQVRVALDNTLPVLITGEKGVGKEIAAKTIHWKGLQRGGGWVRIDCSGLDSLPEIFTEKRKVIGRNSVYFNNIEELDIKLQADLKDFLEESSNTIRVIAASSINLQEKMERGKFNGHLFYQLTAIPIYLPPLRERKEEIPAIADYFLKEAVRKANQSSKEFSLDALEALQNYWWPGNLMELESVVTRSAIFSKEETISSSQLLFGTQILPLPRNPWKGEDALSFESLAVRLAHKIKNPMVAIKTFSQLLPEKYDDTDFRNQFCQVVNKSVDRIDYFLERTLKYGEMTSPNVAAIELQTILHRLLDELEDLEIQKDFAPSPYMAWIDEEQFSFIFEGILRSITSSLPKESRLTINTRGFESNEEEEKSFANLGLPSKSGICLEVSYPRVTDGADLELIMAQQAMARLGIMEIRKDELENTIVIKLSAVQR